LFSAAQASLPLTAAALHIGGGKCGGIAGVLGFSPVVGYQEVAVPAGSSMRTSTFKAISGNYKISDIKVTGALGYGTDTAQKINANGSWGDLYYYLTMDGTGYVEDGWYKDDFGGTPVTDADVLEFGEALIITASGDFTLTYAGQVASGVPTVSVPAGSSIIGNPIPVGVTLSEVAVSGALGYGTDTAQKINANGSWGDLYYYLTMDGTGYVEDGWYKDDFGGVAVTSADALDAGESMIFTAAADLTLTFPTVLPAAQ
jgi:hypothetical protein